MTHGVVDRVMNLNCVNKNETEPFILYDCVHFSLLFDAKIPIEVKEKYFRILLEKINGNCNWHFGF